MKLTNLLIIALTTGLVLALVLSSASGEQWEFLVEYGWVLVLAIGFVGLVGAREKTPEMA
ncbi:MAG: hypothetical protein CSH49_04485 [Alcanivorax sp.]|nr:MAG: hypothetical protein CSH49_04485 [Alcanivorax sp.]